MQQDCLVRATVQRLCPASYDWWVERCEVSRDDGRTWRTSAVYIRHASHVASTRNPVMMGTYLKGGQADETPTIH